MNRCLITATGAYGDGLLKAIEEWMELYRKDLPENLELRVSKSRDNDFSIAITPQLDNERFIYLVNYIHWTKKIGKGAEVEGFTFARDPEWFQEETLSKEVMVCVSADDDEGDNVNVVDENNHVCKLNSPSGNIQAKSLNKKKQERFISGRC